MRNLNLSLVILYAAACNTTPFSIDSTEKATTANSVANAVVEDEIRFSFGLRNFREINAVMHGETIPALTEQQVNPGHNSQPHTSVASSVTSCVNAKKQQWGHGSYHTYVGEVNKVWCSGVKDLLPKSNNILSLTGPTQVGIFKLASAYCKELMQDNDRGKQARVQRLSTVATQLNAIKMSQRPAAIDTSLQNSLAAAFIEHFHGTQTVRPDAATSTSTLVALMADLSSTQEEGGHGHHHHQQASNQEVLVGVCNAALASAQMMFY